MSTGRNDPCPCGSGLKYKKCCLHKQTQPEAPKRDLSDFDLVALFAYAGRIGRQRKAWCKGFLEWKATIEPILKNTQMREAAAQGKGISCSKGCWYCCTQFIGASLQECEAIVYWLYQHRDICNVFIRQYPEWRARVSKHETLFQGVTQAGNIQSANPHDKGLQKAFLEISGEFGKLDIPCPFLDKKVCSIYPVRPFSCMSLISLSPPEYCKPSVDEIPFVLAIGSTEPPPAYFYGPSSGMTIGPAAQFVYEILKNGFTYIDTIPRLRGIEAEAYSDPEIATIIKNNVERLK